MNRLTSTEIIAGHYHNIPTVLDMQQVVDRLAEYEDTGLTPEVIKSALNEDAIISLCAQALGVSADRLRELAAADREGRVVVLPCKVGDTVYTVDLDCEDNPEHTKMCFCWNKACKSCEKAYLRVWENHTETVDIRSIVAEMGLCGEDGGFGKTVFLTRSEAEAALEEQEAQHDN